LPLCILTFQSFPFCASNLFTPPKIGDAVAGDLESQRNQLLNAHDKVTEMKGFTSRARQLLNDMSWRDLKQKLVLVGIIIMLLIAIVLVVYYRFLGGGSSSSSSSGSSSSSNSGSGGSSSDAHQNNRNLSYYPSTVPLSL
jgi:hypothetical protein